MEHDIKEKTKYSSSCEDGKSAIKQDMGTEVYWCGSCRVPIIRYLSDESPKRCACCGCEIRYLAKDLRPVFPEERLLIELIEGKPLKYLNSSVWACDSRYYIDGKSKNLSLEKIKKIDVKPIIQGLDKYKNENTYSFFNAYLKKFIDINSEHLSLIKEEAFSFVRQQIENFPDCKLVISFSGGKDSTVVADVVTRALSNPRIVHIFGDTTLEFPTTYTYIERYRKNNPQTIVKSAKNKDRDFYSVCDEIGPPARMMRWCCTMFKTGPITRTLGSLFRDSRILTFYGIRKNESASRSKYERVANGASVKIQKQTVAAPIFYWSDIELWLYMLGESVDFNDAYRLGYDRVGCWCRPNNNVRSQFLAKIYMPEQAEHWRNYLINFAKRIGKPDPEVYVDEGKWKARQGGNGLAAAEDVKIRYTNCTAEDHAKIYKLNKPIDNSFYNLFVPFGKVSMDLGRKLLHEVIVLDLATNVPILSIQPFNQADYEYSVKIRTMNVADHEALRRMVAYQVRKYNACRKCLKCESVCPFGAIAITSLGYKIDETKCKHCKKCVTAKYLDGGCLMDRFLKSKEEKYED